MNVNLKKLQDALATGEFDGLLITSPHNRLYVTGFASTAGIVLIAKSGAVFATDFRYFEAAQNAVSGLEVVQTGGSRTYSVVICEFISSFGIKRLGVEKEFMTCSDYEKLCAKVSSEFCSADNFIKNIRAVKSAAEVDSIRHAQRIAETALERVLPNIKEGVRECDIAAELVYQMYLNGGEKVSFDPIVVSGRNSSLPHGNPTDKKVAAGDFVTMDFGCKFNGYCSDMTRTVAVGFADEQMKLVYDTVLAAQQAGIDAARAGVPCRDIDAAARNVIERAGFGKFFGHSLGHGVGVEIHEQPYLSPVHSEPLPEGSVVTSEPGIYLPYKFGVRIEDMLYIRADGAENLTAAPKQLMIVG